MDQEIFKQFMEFMKPFMKSHGFSKKNNNFFKRHPQGNIGTINFQKDRWGSEFTINVSTYSYALAEFFLSYNGEREVKKYPSGWDGHWCTHIGNLIPSSERVNLANSKSLRDIDKRLHGYLWWRCSYFMPNFTVYNVDAKELFDEISPLIAKFAIPAIDQYLTDEQLKNFWLSREDIGNTRLATLLMLSGEKEKLKIVLNKLLKDVQDPSGSKWLKADYDRIVKAAGLDKEEFKLSGVVNFPPGKDRLSKEELLALYDSLREEDSADWEVQWKGSVQLFSKVIKLATPLMESQGFTRRKRSNDFCKRYATGDVGIISFKKEHDRLEFRISAGIYTYAGAEFGLANYEKKIITDPQVIDCH